MFYVSGTPIDTPTPKGSKARAVIFGGSMTLSDLSPSVEMASFSDVDLFCTKEEEDRDAEWSGSDTEEFFKQPNQQSSPLQSSGGSERQLTTSSTSSSNLASASDGNGFLSDKRSSVEADLKEVKDLLLELCKKVEKNEHVLKELQNNQTTSIS